MVLGLTFTQVAVAALVLWRKLYDIAAPVPLPLHALMPLHTF